jgi:hypothetical protein
MMHIDFLDDNWYRIVCTVDDEEYTIGCVDDEGTFYPEKKVYNAAEASCMCKGIEEISNFQKILNIACKL